MISTAAKLDTPLAEPHILLDSRYQVIEILSARLWARTYLAQDLRRPNLTGCIIHQLKFIPVVPNYQQTVRELFHKEAAILELVGTHAQIPQLLAWFEDEQGFYVVQEFVHGQPLSLELQPTQCWSAEAVLQLLHDVLEPLAWVHRHGAIHGNLKPTNILRRTEDGQLILIDLSGMSLLQHALMTAHGLHVPTAIAAQEKYQPLEQMQGLPCAASDIYALGMIAIQALTGIKPADLPINPETGELVWKNHLPSSSPLQADLIPILQNMVQGELPRRYGNAAEVLLALQAISPSLSSSDVSAATNATLPATQPTIDADTIGVMQGEEVVKPTPQLAQLPPQPMAPVSSRPVEEPSISRKCQAIKAWKTAIANPSVQIGAGGVVVATTFAAVGWNLLNSVDWSEQTGRLWQRMMTTANTNPNSRHSTVAASSSRWRQEWQQANRTFQQAETAFKQGEWAKAKELIATIPNIPYWQDRGEALIQQEKAKSFQQLEVAFKHAHDREFTKALAQLDQIPAGSPDAVVAQTKMKEYREKQNVKAWFDLQRAYDRAIVRDFAMALAYLYQIPEGTDAYAIAQTKIEEYKQKRDILAQPVATVLEPAQPVQMQLVSSTAAVSTDSSVNQAVNQPIAMTLEMEPQPTAHQIDGWLQMATEQVNQGQIKSAIATLENVPIGTPQYAEARERLVELRALLQPRPPAVLHAQHREPLLNPGDRLREPQSFIVGRAALREVMNK